MNKKIGFGILIAWGIIAIVWDIFLALDKLPGNTWSEIMAHYSYYLPFFPVCFGYLSGHLFLNRFSFIKLNPKFSVSMIVLLVLIGLFQSMAIFLSIWPGIPFLISLPLGALLWPQHSRKMGLRKKAFGDVK